MSAEIARRSEAAENHLAPAQALYLDLMKRCLTRYVFGETHRALSPHRGTLLGRIYDPLRRMLASRRLELVRKCEFDPEARANGRDWAFEAETMIGLKRLDNLQACCVDVIRRKVPGDFIETGAWRGGATIFMRAVLAALEEPARRVWVADSFEGLPRPDDQKYPVDQGDRHWGWSVLAVPIEEVKRNFEKYDLLDDRVRFLKGWFKDTLPAAPIERLAILRLDGDMYESTLEALTSLYPKVSRGGYVIIDDFGAVPGCRKAVEDYRAGNGISAPMKEIDWSGVFWEKHD